MILLLRGDGEGFSEEQLQMYKDCFKLMDINKVIENPTQKMIALPSMRKWRSVVGQFPRLICPFPRVKNAYYNVRCKFFFVWSTQFSRTAQLTRMTCEGLLTMLASSWRNLSLMSFWERWEKTTFTFCSDNISPGVRALHLWQHGQALPRQNGWR